mmetsp:Transcript_34290/g.110106  ORF Transcript_34290/g.110106 Transcript_34290/m.110106 type:complete len:84 (-) Transcript_34290:1864-2115(-)
MRCGGCGSCGCSPKGGSQLMLWRTKNGEDVFTGIVAREEPNFRTEWADLGAPNFYMLEDRDDIDGPRILMNLDDFLREMKQYD